MAVITQPLNGEDEQMLVSDIEDPDSTDSMEVQLENATIVKKEKDDEPKAKSTWVIREFSTLSSGRNYSDLFKAGGCNWRVLLFPKGTRGQGSLSMFIDCADAAELPFGWSRDVEFSLTVVNQIDANRSIKKDAMQNFNSSVTNSGFEVFMLFEQFNNPSAGFLVDDTCIIIADIAVRRIVNNWVYNSKQQTGYVGLKNQGATCYMNALLQTLFHIPYFRKAVNNMPTKETASSGTITLALRDLFYKLQYNDKSVATKDLTIAFGWNTQQSLVQHDVQELNRVLCDKLEGEMKGTVVEGTIETLFEGHVMNYIECINMDMKSTRKESFHDLQLDVKGCRDVYASFDKYVDVERLEGDNKYKAEEHGLQDAKKGILFTDFPPVLQLHLKRFEYDLMSNEMVKINDRYKFPLELDLDREDGKYLSPDADRTVRNLYTLHSTLVHSGNNVHGGHYYTYINPNLSDKWYKFDDERVTKVDINNAVEEQYGGEEKLTRASSAYMLVYVRESDKEKIMCDVGEKEKLKFREEQEEKESKKRYKVDASLYTNIKEKIMWDFGEEEIRDHLKLKLRKDQKEKDSKKKYKAVASLYTNIKVICDKDLREQIGDNIYFDLVDIREVHPYRVKRQMLLNEFKEVVAEELGVPAEFQRFWIWTKRRNLTQRPSRPLDDFEELKTIDEVKKIADVAYNVDLKLYLEVELGPNKFPISPPKIADQEILIFFKLYDPEEENVRYIGRLFVNISSTPAEILSKLNWMSGYARDEKLQFFEEVSYRPDVVCNRIDDKATFLESRLEDGDIICIQNLSTGGIDEDFLCPDVPSFFAYLLKKQIVNFRSLENPREDGFSLDLLKTDSYGEVVGRLSQQIKLEDPSKIRLTGHDLSSHEPKLIPIEYQPPVTLIDMLLSSKQLTDIMYYEVLDVPYPELLLEEVLNVGFYNPAQNEVTSHNIRIQKSKTVGDLLLELKTRVKLSDPEVELRLVCIYQHKIYKIFSPSTAIEQLERHEFTKYSLRTEEIPAEEKNRTPEDRMIHVYHYMEANQNLVSKHFGEPFLLFVRKGDTLSQVKLRIQTRLQVPDDEFSKWKFAFVLYTRLQYLQDSDIVAEYFQKRCVYGDWEQYLGLEHTDTTKRKACAPKNHRLEYTIREWIQRHLVEAPSGGGKVGCEVESVHKDIRSRVGVS